MEKMPEKKLSEKQIKILEIAAGIICGLGLWALIWLSGQTKDGLLQYSWVALFAIVMFGQRSLEKKTNRVFKKFRLALLISLGAGLAAFAVLMLTGVFKT